MNIYDILSEKFNVRKLTKREKVLCTVLLFLLIQLIITKTLIAPRKANYEELYNKINESKTSNMNYDYSGLDDFKDENLELFIDKNNLSKNNISLTKNMRENSLAVNGEKLLKDIDTIGSFIDYYGFKTIELNRTDGNNFSYRLLANKPGDKILHKDLKSEYFSNENKITKEKENLNNDKETHSQSDANIKEIKNTKGNKDSGKSKNNKNISKTTNKKIKKQEVSTAKELKDVRETIPNEKALLNAATLLDFEENILDKKELEPIFKTEERDDITEFKEFGIISFYEEELEKNNFLYLDLLEKSDELKLDLFIPSEYNGSFGVKSEDGKYLRYEDEIKIGEWNTLNFNLDNISIFYYLPNDNAQIIFYLRDVDEEN